MYAKTVFIAVRLYIITNTAVKYRRIRFIVFLSFNFDVPLPSGEVISQFPTFWRKRNGNVSKDTWNDKTVEFWVLHKNDFLRNTRFFVKIFQSSLQIYFFQKLALVMSGALQKMSSTYKYMNTPMHCHACSDLLIRCAILASRSWAYLCRNCNAKI